MFRSCGEAPASSASRTSGSRSATVGSAASSSIVVSAPDVQRAVSAGDPAQRQARDVDQLPRLEHAVLEHQVELGRAAGEVLGVGIGDSTSATAAVRLVGAYVFERLHRYPLTRRGDLSDRGDDVRVRAAPAEVAAHELADLLIRSSSSLRQQADRRHDLPRRAVTALKAVVPDERLLHRVEGTVARRAPRSSSPPARRTAPPASGKPARACRRPARCMRRTPPDRTPSSCRLGRAHRAARRAASPDCPTAADKRSH